MLLSPAEFDRIQEQETARFMASVSRGINDADGEKVLTSAQAKSRLGIKKQNEKGFSSPLKLSLFLRAIDSSIKRIYKNNLKGC